jgi:hypothetical protein
MENGFDQTLENYLRLDLRIYRKWNAAKRSNMLSLDIQNASSEKQIVITIMIGFNKRFSAKNNWALYLF